MEFFEAVKNRHSTRAYKKKEVEEEKLRKILEVANAAPSAGDLQGYEIVLVRDESRRAALAEAAYGQDFVAEAPVVLVFCANPVCSAQKYGTRGSTLYCIQDATIAASYAQLAATAQGLATCWVGAFDERKAASVIGVTDVRPIIILPIGYTNEKHYITPRRKLDDLVHKETL
jgi:nitroreductase